VGGQRFDGVHPGAGDVGPGQPIEDRRPVERPERGVDELLELLPVPDPALVGREAIVAGQRCVVEDDGAEPQPFVVVLHGHHDLLATGGGVGPIGHDHGVAGARPPGRLPAVHRVVERVAQPFREAVEQGDVDGQRLAGAAPVVEGGQDPGVGVHARRDVDDRQADPGVVLLVAAERQQARLALHQEVVGLRLRQRPRAVPGDGGGDEPGERRLEGRGVEAEGPRRVGRDVVDEDVGPFEEGVEHPASGGGLHVELDGLLAPVEPDEHGAQPGDLRVVVAGEVAGTGPLDLDHPGPEVGQLPGGEGSGDRLLEGDDEDALERCGHPGSVS
jgi:hypothetical protein